LLHPFLKRTAVAMFGVSKDAMVERSLSAGGRKCDNAFIRRCLKCDYIHTQPTLDSMLNALKRKRECSSDDNDAEQQHKRHKRQYKLVIPHPNLPSCGNNRQRQESSHDIQLAVTKQRHSS
jgi:hypothetical protein